PRTKEGMTMSRSGKRFGRKVILPMFTMLMLAVAGSTAAQEITLLIHPTLYAATGGDTGVIADFTEATGIVVNVVTAPTDQLRERAVIEYVGGAGTFDVATLQDAWMNEEIAAFLEPLQDRLAASSDDYRGDDLIQSLIGVDTVDGGRLAVPFRGRITTLNHRA